MQWRIYQHMFYSLDRAPSDYSILSSFRNTLLKQEIQIEDEVKKKKINEFIASKDQDFFYQVIHELSQLW